MDVVLTNPRNAVSAVRLGLPVVMELRDPVGYNNIINWGRSDGPDSVNVINKGSVISRTVDKASFIHEMLNAGVSAPAIRDEAEAIQDRKWVVRPNNHEEGSDFRLHDVELEGAIRIPAGHHATLFIEGAREYRIWFAGNTFLTAKRIPRPSEGETDETCRSKWGYSFRSQNFPGSIVEIRKALAVIPIQFGAFDLLWATEERKWYILEVNSAPSLDHERVRSFMCSGIRSMMRPPLVVPPSNLRPPQVSTAPVRRRIKVMTMEGWQEIEV